MDAARDVTESFTVFVKDVEPRLRHALVAVYGQEQGREATAEALAYAWEQWDRVESMENPAGYLYRVGRSQTTSARRLPAFLPVQDDHLPEVEPGLPAALSGLSEKQRVAVVMVHGYRWPRQETAEMLEVSTHSIQVACWILHAY